MKNVTFMIAALSAVFLAVPPARAAVAPSDAVGLSTAPVSDRPLADPGTRTPSWLSMASDNTSQASNPNYFFAPGTGPRCEIRMKRVQGRLYRSCE